MLSVCVPPPTLLSDIVANPLRIPKNIGCNHQQKKLCKMNDQKNFPEKNIHEKKLLTGILNSITVTLCTCVRVNKANSIN